MFIQKRIDGPGENGKDFLKITLIAIIGIGHIVRVGLWIPSAHEMHFDVMFRSGQGQDVVVVAAIHRENPVEPIEVGWV